MKLIFYTFCTVLVFGMLSTPSSMQRAIAQDLDDIFTVILEGGSVYDGLGNAPSVADIGILADRIVAIGDLKDRRAGIRIDVRGLAVVPGLIDIHSHADGGIIDRPLAENYTRQGVTTAIGGQDGSSPHPFGEYLARLEATPSSINFGMLVGQGTVRSLVMGNENRDPAPDELTRMQALVAEAMKEGALGLSSGLEYTPGTYAKTEEIIALARTTAYYGGIYISHIRDEGGKLLESVEEVIRIGEEGGLPAQVTHHKVVGPDRWGRSEASLRLIDEARGRGVDAASDVYPYAASSTGLTILFPGWSLEGTREAQDDRLTDPDTHTRIKDAIATHLITERGGKPSVVVMSHCTWDTSLNGKSLADLLEEQGRPVTVYEAAELAIEIQSRGGCQVVLHSMSEEDVRRIMRHPSTMIASDGGIPAYNVDVPHPRSYGSFARVLGRYVREWHVLSFEEALFKMTGLPAQRLGLKDRGVLREGAVADIAVLDPTAVIDNATFAEPHQYATGVLHVLVSGQMVLHAGEPTGTRPGRVLRNQSK